MAYIILVLMKVIIKSYHSLLVGYFGVLWIFTIIIDVNIFIERYFQALPKSILNLCLQYCKLSHFSSTNIFNIINMILFLSTWDSSFLFSTNDTRYRMIGADHLQILYFEFGFHNPPPNSCPGGSQRHLAPPITVSAIFKLSIVEEVELICV